MGVNTIGIIQTDVKNPFLMLDLIKHAIRKVTAPPEGLSRPDRLKYSQNPDAKNRAPELCLRDSGMVQVAFRCEGESRTLSIFFSCDSDRDDVVPGQKIILSMGDGGVSRVLIRHLLTLLSVYGPVFMDESDSDSVPAQPVTVFPSVTVLDLMGAGYDSRSFVTLREWKAIYDASPGLRAHPLECFLGLTAEQYEALNAQNLSYDDGVLAVAELLVQLGADHRPELDIRIAFKNHFASLVPAAAFD